MSDTIRAADGGYLLNAEHFNYTKNELGQPVLNVVGGGGGTVTEADIEKALGYKPIGADDVPVKKVNGATGEVKSTFYVTVTSTGSGYAATADKTAAEVYAAYVAGYAVYAMVNLPALDVPIELPLVAATSISDAIFLGFSALFSVNSPENVLYLTAICNSTAWMAWSGTLARSEDIPNGDAILPPFTAADNDKVLGIVNGSLAWVAKA